MNNNFFIKEGYLTNPVKSFSINPFEYWTEKRIKKSHFYQYHVYEFASKIFKENNFTSLLDIGSGPGTKLKTFFDVNGIDLALIDQPGLKPLVKKNTWGRKILRIKY